jgi:hypothetical protein
VSQKIKLCLLFFIPALIVAVILVWRYPVAIKRSFILAFPSDKWSEYQALTTMLSLGMNTNDVERILGPPETKDKFSIGERWIYDEDAPMADWTCIVEFKRNEHSAINDLELCYVLNIQHRMFPHAARSEMGKMLDIKEPGGTILGGDPTYFFVSNEKTNVVPVKSLNQP